MTNIRNTSLLIDKGDITHSRIVEESLQKIGEGEVLMKIEKYAFTTNNITYAVIGHKLGYWNFFPVDETWGKVPVWGFSKIIKSNCENVSVGEVYYGYYPMSEYLITTPGKVNSGGFADMAKHRQGLSPIYNFYVNIQNDPSYNEEYRDYIPIVRPLFTTSFLNYHYLKDSQFFNADQIVLTSASSKTALGIACMLHKNKLTDGKQIVGLTSSKNVRFVEKTGFYDRVISYDSVENDLILKPTLVVDLLGNDDMLQKIEDILGESLKFISLIGLTDWEAGMGKSRSNAQFFFAPTQAQKIYKEWGVEKANTQIGRELIDFIEEMQDWIDLVYIDTFDDLALLYHEMLEGNVNPKLGYIVEIID